MGKTSISRGFDAGNYAQAYETTDFERALGKLSMNRSEDYVAAFTLGFFSSHTRAEMGEYADHYDLAYERVGKQARKQGIAVEPAIDFGDSESEDHHTSMTYGVLPDRDLFSRAFEARCPEGTLSFGNDPYVGNESLSERQLWRELEAQTATHDAGEHKPGCAGDGSCNGDGCPCEDAGSWCSSVLGILGFEWI